MIFAQLKASFPSATVDSIRYWNAPNILRAISAEARTTRWLVRSSFRSLERSAPNTLNSSRLRHLTILTEVLAYLRSDFRAIRQSTRAFDILRGLSAFDDDSTFRAGIAGVLNEIPNRLLNKNFADALVLMTRQRAIEYSLERLSEAAGDSKSVREAVDSFFAALSRST